jgi:Recombinase
MDLRAIASGQADTVSVERLSDAAGSLAELIRLIDWLEHHDAHLVADDLGFDSADPKTTAVLKEIERWERPRGRPGIRTGHPDLAERIARLRDQGLSLHAIADALNAQGIPTPRGGTQWRASSVQSALGYRRPPPPPPGAPPPRPPHRRPKPRPPR